MLAKLTKHRIAEAAHTHLIPTNDKKKGIGIMNPNCTVRFETCSLVVSRSFLKKASVPFSEEYEMLSRLTKQHPDFTIEVKAAAPRKQQYMPTYDEMMTHISYQEDAKTLMDEFKVVRAMACTHQNAYMHVRRWFLTRFPEMEHTA